MRLEVPIGTRLGHKLSLTKRKDGEQNVFKNVCDLNKTQTATKRSNRCAPLKMDNGLMNGARGRGSFALMQVSVGFIDSLAQRRVFVFVFGGLLSF